MPLSHDPRLRLVFGASGYIGTYLVPYLRGALAGVSITYYPVHSMGAGKEVAAISGNNRYYYLNSLWTLRETLDWLVGGRGLARGRRHPTEVRVGDRIDTWARPSRDELGRIRGRHTEGDGPGGMTRIPPGPSPFFRRDYLRVMVEAAAVALLPSLDSGISPA